MGLNAEELFYDNSCEDENFTPNYAYLSGGQLHFLGKILRITSFRCEMANWIQVARKV